jgi:hypothetical protein
LVSPATDQSAKTPCAFNKAIVVKEVQEYVIRKYPNAACIPVSSYPKSLLNYTPFEMPPKVFQ